MTNRVYSAILNDKQCCPDWEVVAVFKNNYLYLIILMASIALWGTALHVTKKAVPAHTKVNAVHEVASTGKHVVASIFDAIGLYFWNVYRPTWQPGIQPTKEQKKEQRKLFGYNLRIEHIIDKDPKIIHVKNRPTLFIHGWGDTKGSARLFKAYCDVLPGDIITFNFRDRGVIMPKIQHSSMGQLPDVLQALYVLKWAHTTLHLDAIDIFGYSRGGATAVNMIAVLNDKMGSYDKDLADIGIDRAEREKLLTIIQNGCIVLDCPLMDVAVCAEYRFHEFAKKALKALELFSNYKRNGMQAIDMAKKLDGLNLKILMHFQFNDRVVPNKREAEFYQNISAHNPYSTFVVLGNDGGHLHTHRALSNTIHTFKYMYGGSYDQAYADQYHAVKHKDTYANKLLRPGKQAPQCIAGFYAECQQHANEMKALKHKPKQLSV